MESKKPIKQSGVCKHVKVTIIQQEEYDGVYDLKTNSARKTTGNPTFCETQIQCVKCGEELGADLY